MSSQLQSGIRSIAPVLIGVIAFAAMSLTSCKNTPIGIEDYEAKGTIQGQVIDKGTGQPISNVGVTLIYRDENFEDEEGNVNEEERGKYQKNTDAEGRFFFKDLPVNRDAKNSSGDVADSKNNPYSIRINASSAEGYRNIYLMDVNLAFESTGGDGALANLVSNVTIPLSRLNVNVKGKIIDSRDNEPISDLTVEAYQIFNPVINGNSSTMSNLYLATTKTGSNGGFSFSSFEEDASIFFRLVDEVDSTKVVYANIGTFQTPSSDGTTSPTLDIGNQQVVLQDQSSKSDITLKGKTVNGVTGEVITDVTVKLMVPNPATNKSEITGETTTDNTGSFEFNSVLENTNVTLQFEKLDDEKAEVQSTVNVFTNSTLGEQEAVQNLGQIQLFPQNNTAAFYITDITPETGVDIDPSNIEFVYSFSKPVKQTAYTRTDLGFGNNTMLDDIGIIDLGAKKVTTGDIEFSVEWSADFDTLTITPVDLPDANKYRLDLNDGNNIVLDMFTDEDGKTLSYGGGTSDIPYSQADAEERTFSTNANNAKPHIPTIAIDATTNTLDYDDFTGGDATVLWNVDESTTPVKEYEVWIEEDANSGFEYLSSIDRNTALFGEIKYTITRQLVKLGGPNLDVPVSSLNPQLKVRAISKNLQAGDFSNVITLEDVKLPEVINASYTTTASSGILTITLGEPVVKSQIEDYDNYAFEDANGDPVSPHPTLEKDIEYTADFNTHTYQVVLTIADPNDLQAGETVRISTNVKDLAGNQMDVNDADNDGLTNQATF